MQMTTEARAWLDERVRRILARHPLGDPERTGITYELMSHLHAGGEARAAADGRSEVTREDLQEALADAGGEAGLAAAFVQPLARPIERVLFWRRFGAFAIDAILLGIVTSFVHSSLTFLLGSFLGGRPPLGDLFGIIWLMPWGFHEPLAAAPLQIVIALASALVVLAYFTGLEGHDGRTLGKRALAIRVLRADGAPLGAREAFIRNFAKLSPPLLLVDTLVMLLAFQDEKQRASDRIAGTIVVRA